MADRSLTRQVHAVLDHEGPLDVFIIGLARLRGHISGTQFHYLLNSLRDLAHQTGSDEFRLPNSDLVIATDAEGEWVAIGIDRLQQSFTIDFDIERTFLGDSDENHPLPVDLYRLPDDWEGLKECFREAVLAQLQDYNAHEQYSEISHDAASGNDRRAEALFNGRSRLSSGRSAAPLTSYAGEAFANRQEFIVDHGHEASADYPPHEQGRFRLSQPGSRRNASDGRQGIARPPSRSVPLLSGPLTPQSLQTITDLLDGINFNNFVNRESVQSTAVDQGTLYIEQFANLDGLQQNFFPNISCEPEDPLFLELCRHLDRLMLITCLIERPMRKRKTAINLTGGIAQTREFKQFKSGLSVGERNQTVLEVHWLECLRDAKVGKGLLAGLAIRGFAIAVDQVGIDMLPALAATGLAFDYLKLRCEREKLSLLTSAEYLKALQKIGANRIILTDCSDDMAIRLASQLKLAGMQGQYINEKIRAERQRNAARQHNWQDTLPNKGPKRVRTK